MASDHLPVFDEIEHAKLTAARDWHSVEEHIRDVLHHNDEPRMTPHVEAALAAREIPASQPVNLAAATAAAPQQEDTMQLAQLEDDVKADLTQGLDYILDFGQRLKAAAPGIIATSEAVGGQTVGKLIEIAAGKFLPPGVEEEFLALAGRYFGSFGQVPAAPAAPAGTPAP
jgi:hypothetical protein